MLKKNDIHILCVMKTNLAYAYKLGKYFHILNIMIRQRPPECVAYMTSGKSR